jgi:dihydrofolate synthase/folylpolyglutamate synthase
LDDLSCSLKGAHQVQNAATALAVLEILSQKGYHLETEKVLLGLKQVKWEGRLQIVEEDPLIILDGAHNPAAAFVLSRALREIRIGRQRVILVIGMLKDKDFPGFFNEIIPLADEVILTRPDYERAASVSQLEVAVESYHVPYHCIQRVSDAMGLARSHAFPQDLICVTGSLYTVGEVKAHLEGKVPSLLKG